MSFLISDAKTKNGLFHPNNTGMKHPQNFHQIVLMPHHSPNIFVGKRNLVNSSANQLNALFLQVFQQLLLMKSPLGLMPRH